MARTEQVDVVIVGSGPCGAVYARILSEQAPRWALTSMGGTRGPRR